MKVASTKLIPVHAPKATEQVQTQPAQQAWHPLHKASIADELRKFGPQIHLHMLLIVGFEVAILALMKMDHNRQCFAVTQLPGSLPLLLYHSLTSAQPVPHPLLCRNHRQRSTVPVNSFGMPLGLVWLPERLLDLSP